jgi:CDP-glucose 4,6-dehydratase
VDDLHGLAGRRVLLTGHTGFKGAWLTLWLRRLRAEVSGIALDPPTQPSLFQLADARRDLERHVIGDIRDIDRLTAVVEEVRPELILHLAAQSIVLEGYRTPLETFDVNVLGTAAVLEAVRRTGLRSPVVVVTSDKCYQNEGSGRRFVEQDPLGGDDPYSASKGAAEIVAASYRASYFPIAELARHGVGVATARAGNVIGGGDWTPHGLVADVARAVLADRDVELRRPGAIRPWQHVLEPLSGYLTLATRLLGPDAASAARAWNFGPLPEDDATVEDVVGRMLARWGARRPVIAAEAVHPEEAATLRLDDTAARSRLGWASRWRLNEAIDRTIGWWKRYAADPASARSATLDDIAAYEAAGIGVR